MIMRTITITRLTAQPRTVMTEGPHAGAPAVFDHGDGWPGELLVWYSPAFPTGGFAYSQGLETAVAGGLVADRAAFEDWLACLIAQGSLRNDLILLSLSARAEDPHALAEIADLARAVQPSAERARETAQLGTNFRAAVEAGWPQTVQAFAILDGDRLSYPVACGIAARCCAHPLSATLTAFANAVVAALCSAAIRLSVIGQFDGVRVQAALAARIKAAVALALTATPGDIASVTFGADIVSMRHETQTTRLFQS